jgi:thymidine phosphorylase
VTAGAPLLTLHTDTPERFDAALAALAKDAIRVEPEPGSPAPAARPTILGRVA